MKSLNSFTSALKQKEKQTRTKVADHILQRRNEIKEKGE